METSHPPQCIPTPTSAIKKKMINLQVVSFICNKFYIYS